LGVRDVVAGGAALVRAGAVARPSGGGCSVIAGPRAGGTVPGEPPGPAGDPLTAPTRFPALEPAGPPADAGADAGAGAGAGTAVARAGELIASAATPATLAAEIGLATELEELAHRAWPPLRERSLDGWVLRESAGSSRRGNSVWAHGEVAELPAAIRAVERFYGQAGLPPTFQITPVARPAALHEALDAAGYDDGGPTDVCVADLAGLRAAGLRPRTRRAERPDESWLGLAGEVLTTFAEQRVGSLAVLARLTLPALYVTAVVDGTPVAVGRGVLDGTWLGIYSMATLPAARGHGAARAVLDQLADWAGGLGAERAYLQVEQVSTAARRLYARLGFRPVYRYTYRRRPAPAGAR
jgi:GNAT superfamily N-acetyltransferase